MSGLLFLVATAFFSSREFQLGARQQADHRCYGRSSAWLVDFSLSARQLVFSYQRRIHAVKHYFFKRGKRTPLGRTVYGSDMSAVIKPHRASPCLASPFYRTIDWWDFLWGAIASARRVFQHTERTRSSSRPSLGQN